MKKISAIALTFMFMLVFSACGGEQKQPEVSAIMKSIRSEAKIDLPDMADVTPELTEIQIGIEEDKMVEFAYIAAGSGATADEVFIAKLKDKGDVDTAIKKIEERKKMQADLFQDYNPDEMNKINTAVITSDGSYVFFAICNDNEKAKSIFNAAF